MGDSLTIHTTSPQDAGRTGSEATEPARRTSRFDERGIALQTIIIIVVMLAIAGAVSAALFTRSNTAINQLAEADATPGIIDTEGECRAVSLIDSTNTSQIGAPNGNDCEWTTTGTFSNTRCSAVVGLNSVRGALSNSDKTCKVAYKV